MSKNSFANNIRNVRTFLQEEWGRIVPQLDASNFFGVALSTYSKWERDEQHGEASYWKVAGVLNREFRLNLTADDVAGGDLAGLLRAKPDEEGWAGSRAELEGILQNAETCRILGIGPEFARFLRYIIKDLRPELTREDWIGVAKRIVEDPKADLWMYREKGRVREPLYFKTPRPLKPSEIEKIQRVVDGVIEDLLKKERGT